MTDDARALLAQALETTLRARLRQQADPSAWLRRLDERVLPDLVARLEGGAGPDGRAIADPVNAAMVSDILAELVARLRDEFPG